MTPSAAGTRIWIRCRPFRRQFGQRAVGWMVGIAAIVVLSILSLSIGSRYLPLAQAWAGLLHHDRSPASIIVWQLRLPRTLLAIVVGAALAVAGATRLVLAGVALGASLSSITGVITLYDTAAFSSYNYWIIGSFDGRNARVLLAMAPFLAGGFALAVASGHTLNILALGDDQAAALGSRLALARAGAFAAIVLLCGAATAAVGPISFVGLVVPHALRLVFGADQRTVLRAALIAGPVMMLLADIIGRVIARPSEIEAGVVCAFIGAPTLLALVATRARRDSIAR